MLVARYQIRLKDQSGSPAAIFDNFRTLRWQYKINAGGSFEFEIDGRDDRVSLFEPDGQLEMWRSIPGIAVWYKVFEAHIEDFDDSILENGDQRFVVGGTGYTGVLGRRTIAHASDTVYATKSGPAETVMKEYVNENVGPGATCPPRLLESGVMPGMSVEANSGGGAIWTGSKHEQNLLETLQGIADFAKIDFAVVGTGPATYEFRTYINQFGVDRTTVGLDPSTGLNAAGNVPVVFSPLLDNISKLNYKLAHNSEVNAAYIWGRDTGASRAIRLRTNSAAIAISPIGLREASRSGASQTTDADLDAIGDSVLEQSQTREVITFTPKRTTQTLFGVHFGVGDRITVRRRNVDYNKRVVAVTGTVMAGGKGSGESLDFDFSDIP